MKFSKTHEWIKLDQDNTYYMGISNHAQSLLGDIVYVELPQVGAKITANDTIGVIESVKAASDLYSPVNGVVVDINHDAVNNLSLINTSSEDLGWLLKIKLNNVDDLQHLHNHDEYHNTIINN